MGSVSPAPVAPFNGTAARFGGSADVFARYYADGEAPNPEALEPTPAFRQVLTRMDDKTREAQLRRAEVLHAQAREERALRQATVNPRSERLLQRSTRNAADFSSRLDESVQTKIDAPAIAAAKHRVFAEETFAPVISPYSQQLPRRTIDDMSTGDLIRQKRALQVRRAEKLRGEMDSATFQPQLVASSRILSYNYESTLSARSVRSPSYTDTIREQVSIREQKMELARKEREARELEECSFNPVRTKMPALVEAQIAAQRARRAVEPKREQEPNKPSWV
jgi:hypothetical protein